MIPLSRPYFDDDEILEITKVLASGWVSQGPKVKEFECLASQRLGVKNAICVSNCTTALHLALLSLGLGPGDDALVADFTFPATGHSVLYCGARPVFIDVCRDTYNMDLQEMEKAITEKTKVIIPVHTFGQPALMDTIVDIAKENDIKVVEDAACSFGAGFKGKYTGRWGDIGCFSFHARKGITTGEGGMVVTDNDQLAERVRHLAVFGMRSAWDREKSDGYIVPEFHDVGYNYKMSDINAAVGVAQMRKMDAIISRKKQLAKTWDDMLSLMEGVNPPMAAPGCEHIYQSYVCRLDRSINRNKVIERMRESGVQTQIGTYASHTQPVYRYPGSCPVSKELQDQTLALPLFHEMTEDQVVIAGESLKKAIGECK